MSQCESQWAAMRFTVNTLWSGQFSADCGMSVQPSFILGPQFIEAMRYRSAKDDGMAVLTWSPVEGAGTSSGAKDLDKPRAESMRWESSKSED